MMFFFDCYLNGLPVFAPKGNFAPALCRLEIDFHACIYLNAVMFALHCTVLSALVVT
jgi:hypothetical protein